MSSFFLVLVSILLSVFSFLLSPYYFLFTHFASTMAQVFAQLLGLFYRPTSSANLADYFTEAMHILRLE